MQEDRENKDGSRSVRRIVVQDTTPAESPRVVQGRRLADPPGPRAAAGAASYSATPRERGKKAATQPPIGKTYLFAGLAAGVVGIALIVTWAMGLFTPRPHGQTANVAPPAPVVTSAIASSPPSAQTSELTATETAAREVIRRISRDSKPYSFSERAIQDIQTRVHERSESPYLGDSLHKLQQGSEAISTRASKEGLQPSLVALLALALTKGGQAGDSLDKAASVVPSLASLNRMFGSSEADSSLILIAAFREGVGTHRSHPLLRRMKTVVSNPLTDRNVWYLHDQNVVSNDGYDLVVDVLAYGVIARNPREFGLDNDPLNL